MMGPADLARIRRIPILDVAARLGLNIRGKKAMCFGGHDSLTASLSFVPAKGIWRCFGCGRRGDGIALVMAVLECDFRSGVEWFAREFGIDVRQLQRPGRAARRPSALPHVPLDLSTPSTGAAEADEFVSDAELYTWLIERCGEVTGGQGLKYLRDHGIPIEVASRYGVRELRKPERALHALVKHWGATRVFRSGLAWGKQRVPESLLWPSYAILFPFYYGGSVRYIQGRLFRGPSKYLNPRGVPKPLYNADRLERLPAGAVVHICEGVPDALAFEAQGVAAVGVLGASSFRDDWVDDFLRLDVVISPDGDAGGETFRALVSRQFAARGKAVRVVRVPMGKDVADVISMLGEHP